MSGHPTSICPTSLRYANLKDWPLHQLRASKIDLQIPFQSVELASFLSKMELMVHDFSTAFLSFPIVQGAHKENCGPLMQNHIKVGFCSFIQARGVCRQLKEEKEKRKEMILRQIVWSPLSAFVFVS